MKPEKPTETSSDQVAGTGDRPLWREEFSIYNADERYVSRRQLTKFLTLTSLAMFAGSAWILVKSWLRPGVSYPERAIARAGEIPVDGVKLFEYPGPEDQCILVRTGEERYVAFSQKCTHLSCAVYYSAAHHRIECPCHEGYFSIEDGAVLQGPPTRPLPRVILERRGADLVAIRMKRNGRGNEYSPRLANARPHGHRRCDGAHRPASRCSNVAALGDARRLSRRPLRCRSTRRCHFRRPISRLRRTLPVCQSPGEAAETGRRR